jgi:hypothetical protein
MCSLAGIFGDLRYNISCGLLRKPGAAMNDFKDETEKNGFGCLGRMPEDMKMYMIPADALGLGKSLMEHTVKDFSPQAEYNAMMTRFIKTFGATASAPAGGDVLFSWKGLI